MNIYVGYKFDMEDFMNIIVTTDFDKCEKHLLTYMELSKGDYDYGIEIWNNEKCIHGLIYDKGSKRFVDLRNF